jgi:MoaA/NifB/PqqE/SkfB family radical SAM enzyme
MEISYSCNLSCKTCNIWKKLKTKDKSRRLFDTQSFKDAQRSAAAAGIKRITYLGGEPFLNKDILELASDARSIGISPCVVTNGTLIDEAIASQIIAERLFDVIIFSVDGPGPIHNNIRGAKDAFQKVESIISYVQKYKKKHKLKFPKVYVYMTVSKYNYEYIEDMLSFAQKYDVNALKYLSVSCLDENLMAQTNSALNLNAITAHSYDIGSAAQIPAEKTDSIKLALENAKAKAKRIGLKLFVEEKLLNGRGADICGFLSSDLVITAYGDVLLCPMLPEYITGNIKDTSLKEILQNPSVQKNASKLFELSVLGKLPICSQCCVEKLPTNT